MFQGHIWSCFAKPPLPIFICFSASSLLFSAVSFWVSFTCFWCSFFLVAHFLTFSQMYSNFPHPYAIFCRPRSSLFSEGISDFCFQIFYLFFLILWLFQNCIFFAIRLNVCDSPSIIYSMT